MRLLARLFARLFAIDTRSLAAFRIATGGLVLVDLWTRSSALAQHYSDLGVLPRAAYARLLMVSDWQWSIHLWTGSVAGQSALFLCAAAAACALVVGYHTRAASIVTWALLVSLQARNPMVLYGADQLLRLLLFWSMFLPLGSAWSIDQRRGAGWPVHGARQFSTATATLLLQPCVMYFFAGLLKSNDSWRSGNALGYALSAETYVTPLGRVLAGFPGLVSSLSPLVPWLEMLAPLLLLMPWRTAEFRRIGLLLLFTFHVAMGAVLQTGLFQVVALAALIPFLSAAFWDRLGKGVCGDAQSPGSAASLAMPMKHRESPAVRASAFAGWRSSIAHAVVAILFLYVLAWNVVGLNVENYAAQQGLSWMKEWWGQGKTGVPLTFRDYAVERRLGGFGWIGRVTGLHQRWDMFETVGPQYRGWPAIEGTLSNGQKVSLLDGGRPGNEAIESQLAPQAPLAFYPGTRWLVYFTYLRTSGTQMARELLPAVVTRDWETRNAGTSGSKLEALQIRFVQPASPLNESATMSGPDAVAPSMPTATEVWYDGPARR